MTKLGARWAASAAALAADGEAVLICVGYDRELRDLVSAEALLNHLRRDAIIAVLSTVHPRTVRELAEQPSRSACMLVDSTCAAAVAAADEGTLLSFVGGDSQVVDRLTPVLSCFSTDIVSTGASAPRRWRRRRTTW